MTHNNVCVQLFQLAICFSLWQTCCAPTPTVVVVDNDKSPLDTKAAPTTARIERDADLPLLAIGRAQ